MTRHIRFTPAFAYLLSAMIVWTAFFMGGYGLVAVVCAVRAQPILGLPPAHLSLAGATLVALAVTSYLALRAWKDRKTRHGWPDAFAASLVILQSVVALVAIGWNFLPLIFLDGCGLQEQASL